MNENENCKNCERYSATLHYLDGAWLCKSCYGNYDSTCRLFEYGHENPIDAKGSTAHVRDIKSRRLDTKTKQMFRYEAPKSYFFGR